MATFLLLISAQHRACRVLLPHSLPFLTPILTRVLPVPVLAQGLIEAHFGTISQPSSSAIYITEAE